MHDPFIAICQTPQFFRVRDDQTWVEKGAGLTQELFYRVIQTKRNRLGGSICVGTSALYRREALEPFGGSAEIEHSEDVHTGFMAITAGKGWKVEYAAICLSMGLCPENLQAFSISNVSISSNIRSMGFWINASTYEQEILESGFATWPAPLLSLWYALLLGFGMFSVCERVARTSAYLGTT